MILHIHTHSASGDVCSAPESDADTLWSVTVVLQHADGPLGFDHGSGADAMKALVHDVTVIARANSPGWSQLETGAVSSRSLHSQFKRAVTCSVPDQALLKELEMVCLNEKQTKKNELLARHGKPQLALTPTAFDEWIVPDGAIKARSARWLSTSCQVFAVWSFADWGLYASILGRSTEEVLEPVIRAGKELNMPIRRAYRESDMPAW